MTTAPPNPFRRAAILGTGLIGGSFGLALRRTFPQIHVVGWDKEQNAARQAQALGAIGEASVDAQAAIAGADLVYIALPIGITLDRLPAIAEWAAPGALVTDACSTKERICSAASEYFRGGAVFLGGHPMAGKERSGIAQANAELFHGTRYALIGGEEDPARDARPGAFAELVRGLGAHPVWLDAETHDWAVAIVSHLPQLVSVALARVVREETDETGMPVSLAGSGLKDALRLAGSPYAMWRDIALTNTDNISRALDRLSRAIEDLQRRLTSRDLAAEFDTANELYKILRNMQ
jgi:prephenate dehydrogenase